MSARHLIFTADEEASAALEFLGMAQRSLYRAANAMAQANEAEVPGAVRICYDARHVAKEIQRAAGFAVAVRDLVRKQEVA